MGRGKKLWGGTVGGGRETCDDDVICVSLFFSTSVDCKLSIYIYTSVVVDLFHLDLPFLRKIKKKKKGHFPA